MIHKFTSETDFEKEWTRMAREICQAIYTDPRSQQLKNNLQKNGSLSMEEKSEFISICDQLKYELIYKKYGNPESEGYKVFSISWREWFQKKGVKSENENCQRNSVDHILFGSTPDPEPFLLHFEEEILGSMK